MADVTEPHAPQICHFHRWMLPDCPDFQQESARGNLAFATCRLPLLCPCVTPCSVSLCGGLGSADHEGVDMRGPCGGLCFARAVVSRLIRDDEHVEEGEAFITKAGTGRISISRSSFSFYRPPDKGLRTSRDGWTRVRKAPKPPGRAFMHHAPLMQAVVALCFYGDGAGSRDKWRRLATHQLSCTHVLLSFQ